MILGLDRSKNTLKLHSRLSNELSLHAYKGQLKDSCINIFLILKYDACRCQGHSQNHKQYRCGFWSLYIDWLTYLFIFNRHHLP